MQSRWPHLNGTGIATFAGLAVLIASTTGCGFQLRGSGGQDLNVGSVYIDSAIADGDLLDDLADRLDTRGVEISETAGEARCVLGLDNHHSTRRVASINQRITVERYELRQEIDFMLTCDDVSGPPETLVVIRSYDYDSSNLAGSDSEERLLQREMNSELVDRIVTRFAFSARARP